MTWEIAEGPLDHLRPWVSSCDIFLSNESSALRPETFAARGPCCFLYKRASGGRALGRAGGGRVVGWLGGPVAGWPSGQQAVALQAASSPSGRPGGDAASQVMPTRLGCSSPSTRLPLDFGHQLNPSPVSSWVGACQFLGWSPTSSWVGRPPVLGRPQTLGSIARQFSGCWSLATRGSGRAKLSTAKLRGRQAGTDRAEPGRAKLGRAGPGWATTGLVKQGPAGLGQTTPGQAGPGRAKPSRPGPIRAGWVGTRGPGRAGPGQSGFGGPSGIFQSLVANIVANIVANSQTLFFA